MTATEEFVEVLERGLVLLQADKELHQAVYDLIVAITDTEKAKAEYQRSRIRHAASQESAADH